MTLEELNGAFVDVVGCVNPQHPQLNGYINGAQDLYSALVLNVDKQKSDNKHEDPVTIAEMVSIIKCKGASDLGDCCDRCAFQYTTDECFSICLLDLERINDDELSGIKNALGKQRPVKHHHTMLVRADDTVRISICPVCLGVVISNGSQYPNYCTWCGQAIDWSDRTEEDMP